MKTRFFYGAATHNTWPKLFVLTQNGKFYSEYLNFMKPAQVSLNFDFNTFKAEDYKWGGYQSIIEIDEIAAKSMVLIRQENWIDKYLRKMVAKKYYLFGSLIITILILGLVVKNSEASHSFGNGITYDYSDYETKQDDSYSEFSPTNEMETSFHNVNSFTKTKNEYWDEYKSEFENVYGEEAYSKFDEQYTSSALEQQELKDREALGERIERNNRRKVDYAFGKTFGFPEEDLASPIHELTATQVAPE